MLNGSNNQYQYYKSEFSQILFNHSLSFISKWSDWLENSELFVQAGEQDK